MAAAHLAHSTATVGTGNLTCAHPATGTPQGAQVWIYQALTLTDEISGVTYGGVAMTRVGDFSANAASLEDCRIYVYILDGVLSGAQNAVVTVSGASEKQAVCVTYSAGGSTMTAGTAGSFLVDSSGANVGQTATVTGTSTPDLTYGLGHTGANGVGNIANVGNTQVFEEAIPTATPNSAFNFQRGAGVASLVWELNLTSVLAGLAVGVRELPGNRLGRSL